MKPLWYQLEFKCPKCSVSGLTPNMPADKAAAVVNGHLSLRCPRCSGIIEVMNPWDRTDGEESVYLAIRNAFEASLDALVRKAKGKMRLGGQRGQFALAGAQRSAKANSG